MARVMVKDMSRRCPPQSADRYWDASGRVLTVAELDPAIRDAEV